MHGLFAHWALDANTRRATIASSLLHTRRTRRIVPILSFLSLMSALARGARLVQERPGARRLAALRDPTAALVNVAGDRELNALVLVVEDVVVQAALLVRELVAHRQL